MFAEKYKQRNQYGPKERFSLNIAEMYKSPVFWFAGYFNLQVCETPSPVPFIDCNNQHILMIGPIARYLSNQPYSSLI